MSEPIGQTTTSSLIRLVLAAYPEMKWDGIERTRSASAIGSVFFGGDKLVKKQAYPPPDRRQLGLPISPKLPPVFGPSCMRQKLVSRTVRRPSPTSAVMVRLRSTNTKRIQFTQRLPLGSELHMGKERCCLRGLDHLHGPTSHSICGNLMIYKWSLTNDRLMFEHDESLRADLLPINSPAPYENGKLEHFLHRWMKNREHNNFWLTMFPEKRYFRETTSTIEVAIHTNLFTDLYASIGTGSSRTGGWYTTIMKLPCLFFIRIGFMLASSGGSRSLLRQLQKDKLRWNREKFRGVHNCIKGVKVVAAARRGTSSTVPVRPACRPALKNSWAGRQGETEWAGTTNQA